MSRKKYFAAVEAGGTKFNCAILTPSRDVIREQRIETTTPQQTLKLVGDFFQLAIADDLAFDKLGIASFGPLDLNPRSDTFGAMTKTPKPHWSGTPLASILAERLNVKVFIDTDVNAAALAEARWGAGQGSEIVVYITVGTGVGGGVVINGKTVKGLIHPEIGHLRASTSQFEKGVCPFHDNCVEGYASGTAMGKLWGQPAQTLPEEHPAWQIEADVLAQLAHSLLLTISPQKIIFGGGVMQTPWVLPNIIRHLEVQLNGYLTLPSERSLGDIIVAPGLAERSGLFGAMAIIES